MSTARNRSKAFHFAKFVSVCSVEFASALCVCVWGGGGLGGWAGIVTQINFLIVDLLTNEHFLQLILLDDTCCPEWQTF